MLVFGALNALSALPLNILITFTVLVLDVVIALYLIQDLYQPERRVYGGDKTIWLVIILFGSVLGWAAYLFIGRQA